MSGQPDEFLQFARDAAIVILHLMGGKSVLKDHDIIMSSLNDWKVPVFAAGVPVDAELAANSTVDKKEYQTIHQYIKHGGQEFKMGCGELFHEGRHTGG